jgi:hypothetical protein
MVQNIYSSSICKNHREQNSLCLGYVYIVNLDPTVMTLSLGANIDNRDMVRSKDVMKQYNLGPNGGILTSLKGEDFFIGTKAMLLHHVPIPHCITDINVGPEWQYQHCMVKVNDRYIFETKIFFNFFIVLIGA